VRRAHRVDVEHAHVEPIERLQQTQTFVRGAMMVYLGGARGRADAQEKSERAVLRIAEKHHGRVTAVLVAADVPIAIDAAARALAASVARVVTARASAASRADQRCLRVELSTGAKAPAGGLTSAGLLIVNPPWTLEAELKTMLPALTAVLGRSRAAGFSLDHP